MLSEEVAFRSVNVDRIKQMSLEELEEEFRQACQENADYLRECEESHCFPNGVIAGLSAARARFAEAEILERRLKDPVFREQELAKVKEEISREKAEKGYVGFPGFRQFCLLQELAKDDPDWISQMGLTEYTK